MHKKIFVTRCFQDQRKGQKESEELCTSDGAASSLASSAETLASSTTKYVVASSPRAPDELERSMSNTQTRLGARRILTNPISESNSHFPSYSIAHADKETGRCSIELSKTMLAADSSEGRLFFEPEHPASTSQPTEARVLKVKDKGRPALSCARKSAIKSREAASKDQKEPRGVKFDSGAQATTKLSWTNSDEKFGLVHAEACAEVQDLIPVFKDRLYLALHAKASTSKCFGPAVKTRTVKLSKDMAYEPFCADFGPICLGLTHHFCEEMEKIFVGTPKHTRVVFFSSEGKQPEMTTNAVFLLGSFLLICFHCSADEAWLPFQHLLSSGSCSPTIFPENEINSAIRRDLRHQCRIPTAIETKQERGLRQDMKAEPLVLPYRDATWVPADKTYPLHVKDCLKGLKKAMDNFLYDPKTFDKMEYFHYDMEGDLHECIKGKMFAFRGPIDNHFRHPGRRVAAGTLRSSDFFAAFRALKIGTIVRLNSIEYPSKSFTDAGFRHHDLYFPDCTVPPDEIADTFLRIAESQGDEAIAVHCKAGLGRTGTLIGMYLMKHLGFAADEAIAWLRIVRPGSVIGPQQQYLKDNEKRLSDLKRRSVKGLGLYYRTGSRINAPDIQKISNGVSVVAPSKTLDPGASRDVSKSLSSASSIFTAATSPSSYCPSLTRQQHQKEHTAKLNMLHNQADELAQMVSEGMRNRTSSKLKQRAALKHELGSGRWITSCAGEGTGTILHDLARQPLGTEGESGMDGAREHNEKEKAKQDAQAGAQKANGMNQGTGTPRLRLRHESALMMMKGFSPRPPLRSK